MDSGYGRRYRELYHQHWWWRAREHLIWDALHRHRPATGWHTILDVGCGDGLFFDRLLELGEVEGVEADRELVDPNGVHRGRIHVARFDRDFHPGRQYSLVLMLDVLEHLPDPAAALQHVARLLAPGGYLVATVPAFNLLWTGHDEMNQHYTRYRRVSLLPLVESTGLEIREDRYFFHWLFPAKLLTRAVEMIRRPHPTGPAVPPGWVNRALFSLSRLEQRALRRTPLPFGSSLLLVARKRAGS